MPHPIWQSSTCFLVRAATAKSREVSVINKQKESIQEAIADLFDGATIFVAGFGLVGQAQNLLDAVLDVGVRDLTVVCNNAGSGDRGLAALISANRVRKIICSFPRTGNPYAFDTAFREGRIELELCPQGTISERMRAAAAGLGGYYSRVSAGTALGEGKETRIIDGEEYVFEKPLKGDFALCKALRADRWGNVVYSKTARNFNPVMAAAANVSIFEVSEVVPLGSIDPEAIVTPGIFVDRVVVTGEKA